MIFFIVLLLLILMAAALAICVEAMRLRNARRLLKAQEERLKARQKAISNFQNFALFTKLTSMLQKLRVV